MESACLSIGGVAMNYQESENFIHSFRRFTKEPGFKGNSNAAVFFGGSAKKAAVYSYSGNERKGIYHRHVRIRSARGWVPHRYVCFPLCADLSGTDPGGWTDDSGDRDGGFM